MAAFLYVNQELGIAVLPRLPGREGIVSSNDDVSRS